MEKFRQNGFVLILVITAMALISTLMFALTGNSKVIMFQSDTAYLQACNRNLAASGLAWAEQNIKNQTTEIFDRTIELDVTDMDIRGSTLTVTIASAADKEAQVRINTSCSRARRTLRRNNKYRIQLW